MKQNRTACDEGKEEMLEVGDIPQIKREDHMVELSNNLHRCIQEVLEEEGASELNSRILMKAILKLFQHDLILITVFYWMEDFCKLGFSIMLNYLLRVVADLNSNNIQTAYLLAFFSGFVWFVGVIFKHNSILVGRILQCKIKPALLGLLFKKITKITQYKAKSQELGKIINMLSNDFNVMEVKGNIFLGSVSSPILFVGTIIILITRLGWIGVICPLVIAVFIPIQVFIGKMNGSILQDINVYKDERVKLCTEIIEGIKFIKLYGWEIAFKAIIQVLRKKEISQFIKLGLVKSLERALANTMAFWSGFVCFLVAHFTEEGNPLTTASILSTIEILITMRFSLFLFGVGIGFFF